MAAECYNLKSCSSCPPGPSVEWTFIARHSAAHIRPHANLFEHSSPFLMASGVFIQCLHGCLIASAVNLATNSSPAAPMLVWR
jgi:hypothetical protein